MRAKWRFLLLSTASAGFAGCSLLTSLDGFTGGAAPDGGSQIEAGTPEAAPDAEAGGTPDGDVGTKTTFIVVAGGSKDDMPQSEVFVTRVASDGTLGPWTTAPSLPAGRAKAGLAVVGSRFFLTGGDGPSGIKETIFSATFGDGTLSSWTAGPPLPSILYRHGSFEHAGNVYLVGGWDPSVRAAVLRSPPTASGTLTSFESEASLPAPHASAGYAKSGNYFYVIAGEQPPTPGGAPTPTGKGVVGVIASSGAIQEWRSVTPLPHTTIEPGAAATATHVYVSGGYASGSYKTVFHAPIAANGDLGAWTAVATTLITRAGHRMVVVGRRLYAIGGTDGANNNVATATVEVADIATDGTLGAFRHVTPLPEGRAFTVVTTFER